jgi:hypothetical protein
MNRILADGRKWALRIGLPAMFACVAPAPAMGAEGLDRVAWLAGCWAGDGQEAGSEEHWTALAGETMLGMSRTVKRGKTIGYEFMQIRQASSGSIVYIAQPSGQPPATFTLKPGLPDGEAVFENLDHDFPQRVIYRLQPGGRLGARIEGIRQGGVRGIDYPMHRVTCEASSPVR